MSIVVKNLTYRHSDNTILFKNISFSINKGEKVALIGNNGSGKSTLLYLMQRYLNVQEGEVIMSSPSYYVPQHFEQYSKQTVAEALKVDDKINALHSILNGDVTSENFSILNEDWNIEEKSLAALSFWGLSHIPLHQKMETLSGGEKTKVFLSGIQIHAPAILLMDEPTNHLDKPSRNKLYDLITTSSATIIIVSHDRILLNRLSYIYELENNGITAYGGNYDFYKAQKEQQQTSLLTLLNSKEKELRLARKVAQTMAEKKQKHDSRGKKNNIKKGISRMAMNTLQDKAEKSTSKLKEVHEEKLASLSGNIAELRTSISDIQMMKINFNSSDLHIGKILITANDINFRYGNHFIWEKPLSFRIRSGDRLSIIGNNGSGKTTLLKLITGQLEPNKGSIDRTEISSLYIDQEYSIIRQELSIYEQAQMYNLRHFPEHEVKMILNRYLFPYDTWNKSCALLSGGEKMRLMLCCLMISNQTPDLIILDEPTNNLDIQNIDIITSVFKEYRGTILVVSHDTRFVKEIGAADTYIELH
ncbi:ABC-F family ATP-binding cassette domain-containing protein [Parabacteroides bouchesdurhonensis]|uniref:ABC-F family ATP-binding cassette domain-containing protein n=1 Tax=Parabacteroides bouchesdurhonensis TaxID=1936995 RepID=UPI000C82A45D|nr:ABC-F family ATP-binding cassette domain-containing protein [Parabacteroides bouchesdurhonensis]